MSDIKITTNNNRRELLAAYELPPGVLESEFSYVIPDKSDDAEMDYSNRFFKFRGSWYDTHEFETTSTYTSPEFRKWDGVQTQSVWDAIVIRYVDNYEFVVVGHATW